MVRRVAILGIYHESNTFITEPTTIEDFRKGHWLCGQDIIKEYEQSFHEIGGIIEVLKDHDIQVIPVMYAEATPGGIITAETYNVLLKQLLNELEKYLPVDGCLVIPHGAAVSEHHLDMDGHWLNLIRQKLGDEIPVIGTLDPHANVSESMVAATQALVSYKTNPHTDQRERGKEAAMLLIRTLSGEIRPVQKLVQLPLAISIEQQYTGAEPCSSLYRYAADLCKEQLLSVSINFGFPYADVEEMGTSVIAVTDNDLQKAAATSAKISEYIIENRAAFSGSKKTIEEVLPELDKTPKPLLMLDMGDNVGAGAAGNSTYLLRVFEKIKAYKVFVCLHDPGAVALASQYKKGDMFRLIMASINDQEKYTSTVRLINVVEGKFKEEIARHGGQVHFDMGKTVVVETIHGNTIMLHSIRIPPFSLKQLTTCGIVPESFDILIVKGVNAPIAAYGPVCKSIIQVDTPGATQADMTKFRFRNRRKPLFPFEEIASIPFVKMN